MNDTERDELLELAHGYLEGSLDEEQLHDLEIRLDAEPEARRIFVDFTHDHAALHWRQIAEPTDGGIAENMEALSDLQPRRLPTLWQACAAGAIISLLALVLLQSRGETVPRTFAAMDKTESARWESGDLPTSEGVRLHAGILKLTRGLATIAFDSGAEVILEAPAELELVDQMNCLLHSGTAVAEVTEPAKGFRIETPTAEVIDHGTRFVVNVDRGTGATKTQVFDGLVEVKLPNSRESVHLETGQQNFVAGNKLGDVMPEIKEGTWLRAERPLARGPEWKTLTTGDPGGDDSYVWGGRPNDHVSDELLLLKNSQDLAGPHRKAYLRFSLGNIIREQIVNAELSLRFTPTGWGLAALVADSHFLVYGITDDSLDDWTHKTMNWENAPANVLENGTDLLPDKTILLGEFTVPRGVQSGTFGMRGKKLARFLNDDQNRMASLVVVRTTMETRGGGLVHAFASSRHPSLPAPRLIVRLEE
jgi:hypothetical protein